MTIVDHKKILSKVGPCFSDGKESVKNARNMKCASDQWASAILKPIFFMIFELQKIQISQKNLTLHLYKIPRFEKRHPSKTV